MDHEARAAELEALLNETSAISDEIEIIEADEEQEAEPVAEEKPKRGRKPKIVAPKPEAELTPEEKRIRDLEDQLARAAASKLTGDAAATLGEVAEGDTILLHFVKDGFDAWGTMWYTGQEVEIEIDSDEYDATLDRNGKSWLTEYIDNDYAQIQKYGDLYFRRGPWPGKPWEGQAAAKEKQRARRVPVLRG